MSDTTTTTDGGFTGNRWRDVVLVERRSPLISPETGVCNSDIPVDADRLDSATGGGCCGCGRGCG